MNEKTCDECFKNKCWESVLFPNEVCICKCHSQVSEGMLQRFNKLWPEIKAHDDFGYQLRHVKERVWYFIYSNFSLIRSQTRTDVINEILELIPDDMEDEGVWHNKITGKQLKEQINKLKP